MKMKLKISITQIDNSREILTKRMGQVKDKIAKPEDKVEKLHHSSKALFKIIIFMFLFYVYSSLPACLCIMGLPGNHRGQKRPYDPLKFLRECCELLRGFWEPNLDPLEALLTSTLNH